MKRKPKIRFYFGDKEIDPTELNKFPNNNFTEHIFIEPVNEKYSSSEELNEQDFLLNAAQRSESLVTEEHEIFQLIFQFLKACSLSEAISIHQQLAQSILPESAKAEEVTSLAVELCKRMKSIYKKISQKIPKHIQAKDIGMEDFSVVQGKTRDENENLNTLSYESNTFIPLKALAEELECIGDLGSEIAKTILEDGSHKKFWFNEQGNKMPFFSSPAFQLLARSCWKDLVEPALKKTKQSPALTLGVNPTIRKAQNKFSAIRPTQNKVEIYHDNALIAETAVISPSLVRSLAKGAKLLGSVQGHKILRYQVREGFKNWKSGKEDFRALEYERGFTQIAEELGMKKGKGSHIIKQILEAQAHLYFRVGKTTYGNLIILKQMINPKTGRDEKIRMILGDELLPYQTFKELDARKKLLVPCVDLPPMVGANRTHSQQCELQMEVLEHMTEKSKDYSEEGGVLIKSDEFLQMAKNTGMTKDTLEKVVDRWTQDGEGGGKFLNQVEEDRYRLGESYSDANKLLEDQGKIRVKNSERGKKSASKRARKKFK